MDNIDRHVRKYVNWTYTNMCKYSGSNPQTFVCFFCFFHRWPKIKGNIKISLLNKYVVKEHFQNLENLACSIHEKKPGKNNKTHRWLLSENVTYSCVPAILPACFMYQIPMLNIMDANSNTTSYCSLPKESDRLVRKNEGWFGYILSLFVILLTGPLLAQVAQVGPPEVGREPPPQGR